MDKGELRKQLKQRRNQEPMQSIDFKSKEIQQKISLNPQFIKSQNILCYISYGHEVSTHAFIQTYLHSEKHIMVPITKIRSRSLEISLLSSWQDLQSGPYGILEPIREKRMLIDPKEIDLILVPGVGFDEQGHRLGHGGGYYDWLLSKTQAYRMGLSFEFQMVTNIPIEPHDQLLNCIITEKRVIHCSTKKKIR